MAPRAMVALVSLVAPIRGLVAPSATRLPRPTRCGAAVREFRADEVTLERFVGEVGLAEVTDWEYSGERANPLDPAQPARTKRDLGRSDADGGGGAPLRLFAGTVDDPLLRARGGDARVALREYSAGCARVAAGEMEAHARMADCGAVVALMGSIDRDESSFFGSAAASDPAFVEAWVANLGVDPPRAGARWLVFEWVGVATIASLSAAGRVNPLLAPPVAGGGLFGRVAAPAWRLRDRVAFARRCAAGCVRAVAALHDAGLAHGSLSGSAFALDSRGQDKSLRPTNAALVRVKLQFLGFASPATAPAIAEDLGALGYVLLELLLSPSLADDDDPEPPAADGDALKRLYDDIFEKDVGALRDYVAAEPGWATAVDVLDENAGAGWDAIRLCLQAADPGGAGSFLTARTLLNSPFFT